MNADLDVCHGRTSRSTSTAHVTTPFHYDATYETNTRSGVTTPQAASTKSHG